MATEHDILNLTFNVARLQSLLEVIMQRCVDAGISVGPDDVDRANEQALAYVQKMHPERTVIVSPLLFGKVDA